MRNFPARGAWLLEMEINKARRRRLNAKFANVQSQARSRGDSCVRARLSFRLFKRTRIPLCLGQIIDPIDDVVVVRGDSRWITLLPNDHGGNAAASRSRLKFNGRVGSRVIRG